MEAHAEPVREIGPTETCADTPAQRKSIPKHNNASFFMDFYRCAEPRFKYTLAVPLATVFPHTAKVVNPATLVEYPPLTVIVFCGTVEVERTTGKLNGVLLVIQAFG